MLFRRHSSCRPDGTRLPARWIELSSRRRGRFGPWQRLAGLANEAGSPLALPGYGHLDVNGYTRGLEPGELAFWELLRLGRLLAPERLPDAAAAAAKHFGGRDLEMLLVDHGQEVLVPLARSEPPVRIEGSVAGRAFRQVDVQEISAPGGRRLWLPLLDGVDRLGVLGLTFSELDELTRLRAERFAALLAEILLSKTTYGDSLAQTARLRPMTLAAEMQWSLMPPLTVGSERVVVSGFVQPSYEVGGDIFDYALGEGVAHVAIFDAMGHGLEAALLASVAVARIATPAAVRFRSARP